MEIWYNLITNGDQSFWLTNDKWGKGCVGWFDWAALCMCYSASACKLRTEQAPERGNTIPGHVYDSCDVCSRQANTDIQQSKWEGNYSFSSAPGISPMSLKNFTKVHWGRSAGCQPAVHRCLPLSQNTSLKGQDVVFLPASQSSSSSTAPAHEESACATLQKPLQKLYQRRFRTWRAHNSPFPYCGCWTGARFSVQRDTLGN